MKKMKKPYILETISEQHQYLGLLMPDNPLINVFRFEDMKIQDLESLGHFMLGFYCISIKKNFKGELKYGQQYYDHNKGVMTFISPNQLLLHNSEESSSEGICLCFHPEFLNGYLLRKTVKNYGFFSYKINEALYISEQEEKIIEHIFESIKIESNKKFDAFSKDVIIAQIELLLQYSNRFYNRQFSSSKQMNEDILIRLENLLDNYFNHQNGFPTVQYVSKQLNISPNYLSNFLRNTTGQTTQQHIHNKVIEKAKQLLTTTVLSIGEIAYQLGFEYPQSFNKLFKNKVSISPLEYRNSFLNKL